MKKKTNLLLLFCTLFFAFNLHAQVSVKGMVTDSDNNEPVAGVNVLIKGSSTGTATDFDGSFSINVDKGDILVFSYIGYSTLEITYNGELKLDIKMSEDSSQLDEIILIGYGSTTKDDLTGAADFITSDDFNQGSVLSPEQLISGKLAGVSVTSGSGAPGDGQAIRIRGLGSLSLTNSPLIVVDGVPLNDGGVGGSRNALNSINPADIENMTVLKDASATAIYGSRGSNGVILISTFKGKDKEFSFNLTSKFSTYSPIDKVDVLTATEFTNIITSAGDQAYIDQLGNFQTDWQDEIYQKALGKDYVFSANGNLLGIPSRFSIGTAEHNGVLIGDKFKRNTISINMSPSALDNKINVDFNLRYMDTDNHFADRGAIGSALRFDPTKPVYNGSQYDGYYAWIDPASGNQFAIGAPTNPLALLNLIDDQSDVERIITNFKVDYDLNIDGLTATVNLAYDESSSNGSRVTSELIPTSDPTWNGSLSTYNQIATNTLLDAYLTYETNFDDSSLNAVIGYSYQAFDFDNFSYDSEAEEDGNDYEFIDKSKNVLLSYFGRVNYDLKGKYLFTATLRADASSKLNPNDRWGIFPSFAMAWNVDQEDFFNGDIFNSLKLRLGYGQVGNVNGLGDYKFLTRYTGSTSTAYYQFGSSFFQTFRPEPINPDLRWEIGETLNLGIDYSISNSNVSGSINIYKKTTRDLIAFTLVDPFTNFGNRIDANIGDMENKGIELTLNIPVMKTDNFENVLDFNVAFNDNVVTRLPDQQFVGGISGGVGNTIQTHVEGEAPFSFLVYQQVYDSDGRPIEGVYVDRNNDNVINDDDRYIKEDPFADIIMGLTNSFRYKSWDFSITARASIGNYAYNNLASNSVYNAAASINNILNNIHADYLDTGFIDFTENSLLSDHYIQEASFVKIDNISIGYSVTTKSGCDVRFFGTLQNVATFTDYKGIDPEIYGGIDNNFYPRPQTGVFGVTFEF